MKTLAGRVSLIASHALVIRNFACFRTVYAWRSISFSSPKFFPHPGMGHVDGLGPDFPGGPTAPLLTLLGAASRGRCSSSSSDSNVLIEADWTPAGAQSAETSELGSECPSLSVSSETLSFPLWIARIRAERLVGDGNILDTGTGGMRGDRGVRGDRVGEVSSAGSQVGVRLDGADDWTGKSEPASIETSTSTCGIPSMTLGRLLQSLLDGVDESSDSGIREGACKG